MVIRIKGYRHIWVLMVIYVVNKVISVKGCII
jgi:hypothetical protein